MLEEHYVNAHYLSRLVLQDIDIRAYFNNPFHYPHRGSLTLYLEKQGILSSSISTDQTDNEILQIEVAILNGNLRVIQGK